MHRQISVPETVLRGLLAQAASAARIVGYDEALAFSPLGELVDALVHELTELLGNPHLVAASVPDVCATFGTDYVTRADLVTKRWDEPTLVAVPSTFTTAFTATEPTRLHVRCLIPTHRHQCQNVGKGSTWQAHPPQAPAIEPSRLTTGWVRGATVMALIALLSVILILPRTYSATSLPEIEKGAWRTVALRKTGTVARAAALLGIGHTSLGGWFGHRRPARTVRKRDGPDSLAQTRHILRSARALQQGLRRQR